MQSRLSALLKLCEDDTTLSRKDSVHIWYGILSGISCKNKSASVKQLPNISYKIRDD